MIVAGSERADFPEQTESLLLSVAANRRRLDYRKHGCGANKSGSQMNSIEESRNEPRSSPKPTRPCTSRSALLQNIPVAAWTVDPDGTPDFVNQSWLEYTGQTLEFVRSNAEAWMTAVHPEDREGGGEKLLGRNTIRPGLHNGSPDFAGRTTGHTAGISIEPYRYKTDKEKSSGLLAPQPTLRM